MVIKQNFSHYFVETLRLSMQQEYFVGTAERKNPFHSAGTLSGFEALTSHLGVKNGLKMTSTSHSTTPFCRVDR
jgi:hypothetical protein